MSALHWEQQEETKIVKKRTLEIELSDADVRRLAKKAGTHGLTINELLKNFIGDLVGGTYSNGSDERMHAKQWFERCWFGMFQDFTFLRYLIEWDGIDEVLELWDNIQSVKADLADMKVHLEEYKPDEKAAMQEDIDYWQGSLDDYWKEYAGLKKEYKNGTFDEEMIKVLEWGDEYQRLLESGESSSSCQ